MTKLTTTSPAVKAQGSSSYQKGKRPQERAPRWVPDFKSAEEACAFVRSFKFFQPLSSGQIDISNTELVNWFNDLGRLSGIVRSGLKFEGESYTAYQAFRDIDYAYTNDQQCYYRDVADKIRTADRLARQVAQQADDHRYGWLDPEVVQFTKACEYFDWTYEYSDDPAVWRSAQARFNVLKKVVDERGYPYNEIFARASQAAFQRHQQKIVKLHDTITVRLGTFMDDDYCPSIEGVVREILDTATVYVECKKIDVPAHVVVDLQRNGKTESWKCRIGNAKWAGETADSYGYLKVR